MFPDAIHAHGEYRPLSHTFSLSSPLPEYEWVSQVPHYSEAQLNAAGASTNPAYTQLPDGLPTRIRELAVQITSGHESTYAKARALEQHLKTQYTYKFADGSGSEAPPPGRDPVDWFLFDHREGTCGVFSSVFVVLARSVGIPARVVSGWAISPVPGQQQVNSDQAHQWAEVALQGVGWVPFEPTPSGGPPLRAQFQQEAQQPEVQQPTREELRPVGTTTGITVWPQEIRRRDSFSVGGTVRTSSGATVNGVEVEIYINETKDHGGTLIGTTIARNGSFQTEAKLPSSMQRGPYQLLARAVGNELYLESWSDPDVTVYSESGLELTGPQEIAVDSPAIFSGKFRDDTGSGVAGIELAVKIDGRELPAQLTGQGGEFSFAHTFLEYGPHTVEIEVEEQDFLLGNALRLDLTAVMPTELTLEPLGNVKLDEVFWIEGSLRNVRGEPLPGKAVKVKVADGLDTGTITDEEGRFTATGVIDEVGQFTVRVSYSGDHPVLPSEASTLGSAQHLTSVSLSGPGVVHLGKRATVDGSVSSASLPQIGPQSLSVLDAAGDTIVSISTDGNGAFVYIIEPLIDTGPHSLTFAFEGRETWRRHLRGFPSTWWRRQRCRSGALMLSCPGRPSNWLGY